MRSEKQKAAARENGKKGGRPKTGKAPQTHVSFPTSWIMRLDAVLPSGTIRNRWIMENLEPILHSLESSTNE